MKLLVKKMKEITKYTIMPFLLLICVVINYAIAEEYNGIINHKNMISIMFGQKEYFYYKDNPSKKYLIKYLIRQDNYFIDIYEDAGKKIIEKISAHGRPFLVTRKQPLFFYVGVHENLVTNEKSPIVFVKSDGPPTKFIDKEYIDNEFFKTIELDIMHNKNVFSKDEDIKIKYNNDKYDDYCLQYFIDKLDYNRKNMTGAQFVEYVNDMLSKNKIIYYIGLVNDVTINKEHDNISELLINIDNMLYFYLNKELAIKLNKKQWVKVEGTLNKINLHNDNYIFYLKDVKILD